MHQRWFENFVVLVIFCTGHFVFRIRCMQGGFWTKIYLMRNLTISSMIFSLMPRRSEIVSSVWIVHIGLMINPPLIDRLFAHRWTTCTNIVRKKLVWVRQMIEGVMGPKFTNKRTPTLLDQTEKSLNSIHPWCSIIHHEKWSWSRLPSFTLSFTFLIKIVVQIALSSGENGDTDIFSNMRTCADEWRYK